MTLLLAACGSSGNSASTDHSGSTGASGSADAAPSGGSDAPEAGAPTLVFGEGPTLSAAPAFIANDKGYFGSNVKIDTAAFPSDKALPLLAKGNFTIVAMSFDAATFNAIHRASLIQALSNYAQIPLNGPGITGILVSTKAWNDGLTTPAKLKGKKIGVVAYGGFAEYNAYQALQAGGLTQKDATFVNITNPSLGAALKNGAIDAAWCSEPLCTSLIKKGIAKLLPVDLNKGVGVFQLFVNSEYAKKYPNTVAHALAGWLKAAKELNDGGWHDQKNLEIVSKWAKIPVDVLKSIPALEGKTSDTYTVTKENLTPSFKLADAEQTYFGETGKLTYKGKIDLEKNYDPTLITKALKILGD